MYMYSTEFWGEREKMKCLRNDLCIKPRTDIDPPHSLQRKILHTFDIALPNTYLFKIVVKKSSAEFKSLP